MTDEGGRTVRPRADYTYRENDMGLTIIPPEESNRRRQEELERAARQPVTYSKYKIQLRLQELGLWNTFWSAMKEMGKDVSWLNSLDIGSDNPELQEALPVIKAAFPDLDVDAELAKCVADRS